jgi:hypothetical protein
MILVNSKILPIPKRYYFCNTMKLLAFVILFASSAHAHPRWGVSFIMCFRFFKKGKENMPPKDKCELNKKLF